MSTPGKPRQSGIPGPGKPSSIPTPGRSRSSSSVHQQYAAPVDVEYMSRAFADAIKANDPAQHRPGQTNINTTTSLSPQYISTYPQSGRRSVVERPSSVASTSSLTSSTYRERAKTPTPARPPSRPPSRHSDVFGKSPIKNFEVGDNVRIESLGYEGTLRYIGEIEGKLGLWAGVELSRGFSGKGKNNGTVNGRQYFTCPENCGVFVATIKLSPPTVGVGTTQRPASVASMRGGRITPGMSGRITPSTPFTIYTPRVAAPTGRVTPSTSGRPISSLSSGRTTPGTSAAARSKRSLANLTKPSLANLSNKITEGSRASKYVSMTAKELNSLNNVDHSPPPLEPESPIRSNSLPGLSSKVIPSPSRAPGSPFLTPKPGKIPGIGVGVSSLTPSKGRVATPRARIPSAIAMPPPASPMSSRSVSMNEYPPREDTPDSPLAPKAEVSHGLGISAPTVSSVRSSSSASDKSTVLDEAVHLDLLQSRIQALEYDNERLRVFNLAPPSIPDEAVQLKNIGLERDEAVARVSSMEALLAAAQRNLEEQKTQITSLETERQHLAVQLETEQLNHHNNLQVVQLELDGTSSLIATLKSQIHEQEFIIQQNEAKTVSKDSEIARLESELQNSSTELQTEKIELGTQIDELRTAGQETIALYEERLSNADSQRYDLECRIAALEAGAHTIQNPSSPPPKYSGVSSATLIDNESLREQVLHLQRKISSMEDTMEDIHSTTEREETALRERMKRLKEKEDGMKKELNEGRKEVERVLKSEATARTRVEEIEEALRESTVALENARAEVEVLRVELSDLDSLIANTDGGDLPSRVSDIVQKASADRSRYEAEIKTLQELLQEYRSQQLTTANAISESPSPLLTDNTILELETKNAFLLKTILDHEIKQKSLTETLDEFTLELDTLKKKNNRDILINSVSEPLRPPHQSPSKHDPLSAREEITGLKHIVQELQKENLVLAQRIKILESENELLLTENQQLRQEVQILEENMDQSIVYEEYSNVDGSRTPGLPDIQDVKRTLKDQKARFEMEQEQLRKRLAEIEMKSARTIHDLNKEIGELEALVESKIYREDELEQELERMKDKLQRHKKSSKNSGDALESHGKNNGLTNTTKSNTPREEVCEICERLGHDIFNCDLLKGDTKQTHESVRVASDLFCEDCESYGHVAADCPHSLDVF
ncbi:hypothetical protein BDZ94DRAFT_1292002 [Collybia nuda]|uniref:CAP-Gly domain-containing protein n=1 Tax=Collybia nuda TaxID=64659 RepID=A0A9P5XVD3_9AGAR|nr:hypothetical protein BDZ94DRAFT_1292002 [Collybia nuda]